MLRLMLLIAMLLQGILALVYIKDNQLSVLHLICSGIFALVDQLEKLNETVDKKR